MNTEELMIAVAVALLVGYHFGQAKMAKATAPAAPAASSSDWLNTWINA